MNWYHLKLAMSQGTGISMDALHIFAGLGIQILVAAVLRLRLSHIAPWVVVLTLEIANEWSDLSFDVWPNRGEQWGESLKDLCVTLAVPTLLFLLARWAPGLFAARHAAISDPSVSSNSA